MRPVNHMVGLDNFVDSTLSSTRQCRRLDNVVDSTMSSTRQCRRLDSAHGGSLKAKLRAGQRWRELLGQWDDCLRSVAQHFRPATSYPEAPMTPATRRAS